MDKIKWGIIGLGNVSGKHIASVEKRSDCELSAVCDLNPQNFDKVRKNIHCYKNFKRMLEEEYLDIVSVCTPHNTHFDITKEILEQGSNVLLEKPPVLTLNSLYRLIEVESETGKKVYNVLQYRYNPLVIQLRNIIQKGLIGKLITAYFQINWPREPNYYLKSEWKGNKLKEGGMLYNQIFHHVDLIQFLFGCPFESVAMTSKIIYDFIETEDTFGAIFKFKNGAIINLSASVVGLPSFCIENLELLFSKSRIRLFDKRLSKVESQFYGLENKEVCQIFNEDKLLFQDHVEETLYDTLVDNVVRDLRGETNLTIKLIDVIDSIRIIQKLYTNNVLASELHTANDELRTSL
jgi:predicted dehydrogenase